MKKISRRPSFVILKRISFQTVLVTALCIFAAVGVMASSANDGIASAFRAWISNAPAGVMNFWTFAFSDTFSKTVLQNNDGTSDLDSNPSGRKLLSPTSTTVSYTDMGSITCPAEPVATIAPSVSGLTFSQLSRGSGVACASIGNGINGSGFSGNLSTNVAASKWYTMSITSDAGTAFTVDAMSIVSRVSSAAAGNTVDIQYSIGAGTKTSVGSFTPTTTETAYPITPSTTISAGPGQTVNLFFVPYSLLGSATTIRLINNTSFTVTTTPVEYAVTYDGNGNTGGTALVDANNPYNPTEWVGVAGPGDLVKAGYTFGGWDTAADGSGTNYNPAQLFEINANTTLYAQWIIAPCFETASGSLDTTFDGDGKVTTAIGSSDSTATAVALQPDGMIVTAGSAFNGSNYDFALARYTPTGALDTNFDIDGVVITPVQSGNDYALAVAIQPDGKIIAAGYANTGVNNDFAVVRYNANGTLDTTFDVDGIVTTPVQTLGDVATSVAVQPDGKIVVAGFSQSSGFDFAVVRYNADGSLDLSFDGDGKVTTPVLTQDDRAYSVLIQPDKKIVVVGTAATSGLINDVAVVRYNSNGSLDNSFSGDGKVTTPVLTSDDQARAGALQPDGKIIAAGSYNAGPNAGFSLIRFNADGTLDSTFDGDGLVTTPIPGHFGIALSMALQPDGRIVTAGNAHNGSTYDFTLFRYNQNGSLDTTFDGDGKITTSVGSDSGANGVAIQPDGRIVAAGSGYTGSNSDRAVVRYGGDCPPALSISDVSANEGNSGTTTFSFTVSLPEPAPAGGVTFDIATADGTAQDDNPATEDNDYVARSLTSQTISAGNTTYTFDITVNGDTIFEPDETFFVNVTNVTGANIADGQGLGTIQNDDVDGETIAALDGGGNVAVTDVNDATSEVLTLTCGSGVLTVTSNLTIGAGAGFTQSGPNAVTIPLAGITGSLTVDTLGGNDTLNVNLSGCDFIPAGGLFFNGGAAGDDALNIIGGNQGIVTYGYGTTNGDGTVAMSNFGTITYTGLEPITNSGTSSDVIFNLPAVANAATMADIGGGSSRLSGGTFEQTDFANPTGSVTINRGTAADTLAVSSLAANYPSLAIGSSGGGEFSSISFNGTVTFGAGKNLNAFATGSINFPNAASDVAAAGAGAIGLTTATNIYLAPGSSLQTVDGGLAVNANQQLPATTGNFAGVFVNDATLGSTGAGAVSVNGLGGTTGGGNIGVLVQGAAALITSGGGNVTVQGKAGSTAAANQNLIGVAVSNGGTITAGGAGTVSVTGNGTTTGGVNASHGVWVTGANSKITSGGGAVSVTGTGGTTSGGFNFGIAVQGGGKITSGGNGTVTLIGTGGTGGSNNFGVGVADLNSAVTTSGAGDLSITGNGGSGTGPAQRGVVVAAAATVSSTGAGKVTINGTGGSGGSDNYGVDILDANSLVTTTGAGDLSITGTAGTGTGGNLIGVEIRAASTVSSTGGGKVTINGTGGGSTTFNAGMIVTNATVASNAGDISLIGQGGTGSGNFQIGINIDTGADITATGNAKISINGTGGVGLTDCYGVGFESGNVAGTTVTSVNGDITITGTSTDTTGQRQSGVRFEDSVAATAFVMNITGTGDLSVTGTAGNNDPTSYGIQFVDDTQLTLSGTSNSFIADRIEIGPSNVGINSGANAVSIRQLTNSRSINLGGADSAAELGLTDAELDRITAGTINIGDANSGLISVAGVISPANYKTLSVQKGVSFTSTGGFDSDVTSLTVFEKMLAAGAVSIDPAASLTATAIGGFVPAHGNSFTIIENTTGAATTGTFAGKPEGSSLTLGGRNAIITYAGGTGSNDVVINVDSFAPKVTSTTPVQAAVGVATNSNITLNFSEAVNIAAGGITVDCGGVQAFAPTLPQNGVTSIVIDPTNPLPAGVVCTVTVVSANVKDLAGNVFDGDGNGTGGDNFVLTFTTASARSLIYDGNGNTGGTAPVDANSPYSSGSTVSVLGEGDLVKGGFTFDGWNTAADGSGTSYGPAQTFTINTDTTLYAQWTCTVGPAGSEFRVNTTTAYSQELSFTGSNNIASDPSGNFVVTWMSLNQDGSGSGVYAQRYNAAGVAQGSEFRVNTTTADNQVYPAVAMDAAGNFAVTWMSDNQDGSSWGVYAQRYNAAGVAQGGEFRVNTTTADSQMYPSVAMDAAGNFAVTWMSFNQDGSGYGIYGQRYNAAGIAQGGEFRVNTTTADNQVYPSVAMDAAGNYTVAWMSRNQDGSGFGVYAQRYNAAGVAQGSEFRVNATTASDQFYPSVAMDAAGNFAVTWMSDNQDGSSWGVYAQRYNAAGIAQGGEFRVNTTTANDQIYPSVAMDAAGNFAVTWMSFNQDGSGYGIYGQRYNAAGIARGGEFRVNTTTANDQIYPSVAMDAAGNYSVAWMSLNQDGSVWGIYAQRYSGCTPVDVMPPDTTILTGPTGTVSSNSAAFTFESTETPSTFECALDGGAFAACTSPQNYTGLAEGSHTFAVRATDAAGNTDLSPAERMWTVDTTTPDTTITASPPNPSNSASATFSFSSGESGAVFECSLDGAAFTACSSPQNFTNLNDSQHTFQVRAVDAAGNTDPTPASYTWTVDTTPPDTTITANPPANSNSASAAFQFTSNETGASFQCSLDGGAFAACTSPQNYAGLSDGPHTFQVRAVDAAGNTDATPASYTWTVDTAPPDTTITGNPTNPTNSTSAAFTFTSNETPVTFACSLDGSAFAVCTSPQSYAGLALGPHTFQVRATDTAGNTDPTPASYTWVINSPPAISAASGVTRVQAAGPSVSQIAAVGDPDQSANTLAVTVNGGPSATVNGVTVNSITIAPSGAVSASVSAACGATNASFTLRVTDSGGLFAQATLTITVINETVPPVINPITNVVAILPSNSPATSMAVNFPLPTATDNCGAVVVTTNPVSGSVFPLGTTVVSVTAVDGNGNVSTATFTVSVQYPFSGFSGRVTDPPAVNYFRAGNMVPVTFSIGGNKGMNIFLPGSPSSQQVDCTTGSPIGPSIPANSAGLNFLGKQYQYYWLTDPAWQGTCRTFQMALNDGTIRTANFWFYN